MSIWFHKRRMAALVEAVGAFVRANYQDPPKPPAKVPREAEDGGPRFSRETVLPGNGSDISYSDRGGGYGAGDNYDSRSVAFAVRDALRSDSPREALRTLAYHTDMSFVDKMLDYIKTRRLRDPDVYKAAQVDRRLFSRIVSDRTYKPAKDTCIALSLALRLSLPEANDILARAGYVLSHSSKRDIIIEYFFRERIYDLNEVNEVLFRLDEKLIGR